MVIPKENSLWKHNETRREYEVQAVSNTFATRGGWIVTVFYKDEFDKIWSRPLEEWNDRYTFLCDYVDENKELIEQLERAKQELKADNNRAIYAVVDKAIKALIKKN